MFHFLSGRVSAMSGNWVAAVTLVAAADRGLMTPRSKAGGGYLGGGGVRLQHKVSGSIPFIHWVISF